MVLRCLTDSREAPSYANYLALVSCYLHVHVDRPGPPGTGKRGDGSEARRGVCVYARVRACVNARRMRHRLRATDKPTRIPRRRIHYSVASVARTRVGETFGFFPSFFPLSLRARGRKKWRSNFFLRDAIPPSLGIFISLGPDETRGDRRGLAISAESLKYERERVSLSLSSD